MSSGFSLKSVSLFARPDPDARTVGGGAAGTVIWMAALSSRDMRRGAPAQFGQRRLSLRPPRLFVKCDVAVGIALISSAARTSPVGCPPRLVAGAATMAAVALRRAARINSAGVRVVAVAMAPTSSGPPALSASSASPNPVLETIAASTRPRGATYNRSAHRHGNASYAVPGRDFVIIVLLIAAWPGWLSQPGRPPPSPRIPEASAGCPCRLA
jgi:hypothetical protein